MAQLEDFPTTGQVGRQLDPPLTEAEINSLIRRRPEISPPIVRGRRRWRPEDVEHLRELIAARQVEGSQ